MNTSISEALKEVGALNHRDIPILETVSVYHPSGGSVNIVNDREDLFAWAGSAGGEKIIFEAGSFSLSLPQSNSEGVSFVNIAFPNIDGKASKFLKSVPVESTAPITLVYRIYVGENDLGYNPDTHFQGLPVVQNDPPLTVEILSVQITPFQVNARATYRSLINAKYPNKLYTIQDYKAHNN